MNKKTAYLGLFLALALICSYIESLIPFYFGIQGVKLGLTNIVVVMMLYCIGAKEALLVSLLRIVLAGFMFGNMFSILYSLAGGILSFLIMYLLKKIYRTARHLYQCRRRDQPQHRTTVRCSTCSRKL